MNEQNFLASLRRRGVASIDALIGWVAALYLAGFASINYKQPLFIAGDHILTLVAIQEAAHGTFRLNEQLGAPFKKDNFYFPMFDFSYKIIGAGWAIITGDVFKSVIGLYFVGITLMFFFCRWALRQLSITSWLATLGALAFTICPYFSSRAVGHDFLSLYFGVSLGAAIPLVILYTSNNFGLKRATSSPFIVAALIFSGLSGLYYGLFTIIFSTLGFLAIAGEKRSFRPFFLVAAFSVAILALLIVSTYGTGIIDGLSTPLPKRDTWEQLYHGLYLPTAMETYAEIGIEPAKFAEYANLTLQGGPLAAMSGESFAFEWPGAFLTTIILLAPVMLAMTLCIRTPSPHLRVLTISLLLITFGTLFGVRGGLGYIFNYFVIGALRAQQRIIPFLTFYAIVVTCISWEILWKTRPTWALIGAPLVALGLLVGIYQTPTGFLARKQAAFLASPGEQLYLKSVRDMLAAKNASGLKSILQLPLIYWPESPVVGSFDPYAHQIPYLLEGLGGRTHWSYGLSKKQPEFMTQKLSVAVGIPDMTTRARAMGFDGVLVEATAFSPDNLKRVLALMHSEIREDCVLMKDSYRTLFSLMRSPTGEPCERPGRGPEHSTTFNFNAGSLDDDFLGLGWSGNEPNGTWSLGQESNFGLPVPSRKGPFTVTLSYLPFNPTNRVKSITFMAGESVVSAPSDMVEHVVSLVVQDAPNGIIPITIKVDIPERPAGPESADNRVLGVMLHSAKVEGPD